LTTVIAYDGSGRPEYVGRAMPGTAAAAAAWQIQKIVYGASGPTSYAYPAGNNSYAYVWNDRATYVYS
jgi:hypothetical protein